MSAGGFFMFYPTLLSRLVVVVYKQMHSCRTEERGQLGSVFFLGEVSSSLGSHNGEMIRRSIFLLISLCGELIHFSCQRLMLMSPEEGVLREDS